MKAVIDGTDGENIATILYNPSKPTRKLSSRFEKIEDDMATSDQFIERVLSSVSRTRSSHADDFADTALGLAVEEMAKEKTGQRRTVVLILNEEPQAKLNAKIRELRDKNVFVSIIVLWYDIDENELKMKLPDTSLLYVVSDQEDWTPVLKEIKDNKLTGDTLFYHFTICTVNMLIWATNFMTNVFIRWCFIL